MKNKTTYILLLNILLLVILGISFNFSSSAPLAERNSGDPLYFFVRHLLSILVGAVALLLGFKGFTKFDSNSKNSSKLVHILLFVGLLFLVLVLIPGIGRLVSGARRWLVIGPLSFQPSEVAKAIIIFYLSHILILKNEKLSNFLYGTLPPILVSIAFAFLIAIEPDLSTAIVFIFLVSTLFYVAKVPLVFIGVLGAVALPVVIYLFETKSYLVKRFVFLSPESDPLGKGYHLLQSLQAFEVGGLLGVGPGNVWNKIRSLPEAHTDFLFSLIGGETGFVGGTIIIALFAFFSFTGYQIALFQTIPRNSLLAVGITTLISIEALIHIFVTMGVIPTTGLPLPFLSYGRTAMVVSLFLIGILLRLSLDENNKNKGKS